MNPKRLVLSNVGRFEQLDLDLHDGCSALVGGNGAGKSTILNAIEAALFANGGRDLGAMLAPFGDRLEITLWFEHRGELYRVRRGLKRGGSATLDLEVFLGDSDQVSDTWSSLTRESTAATQAELERLLGLTRRAFRASSFLAQREANAFLKATAGDKKSLLGEMLDGPGLWPRLAELARADVRQVEQAIAADLQRIGEREEFIANAAGIEDRLDDLRATQFQAQRQLDEAEEGLQVAQAAVQANAGAAERHRFARGSLVTARETRDRAATDLKGAQAQAEKLDPARKQLAELEFMASRVPELERIVAETDQVKQQRELALREVAEAQNAVKQQESRVDGLASERAALQHSFDALSAKSLEISSAQEAHCDRCEQILGTQAKGVALESLRLELNETHAAVCERDRVLSEQRDLLLELDDAVTAIVVPVVPLEGDSVIDLRDCRQAAEQRGTVALQIQGYEEHALALDALTANLAEASAVLLQRTEELAQAAEAMEDPEALEQAVTEARAAVTSRRQTLDEAKAAVVRVEEQLARVREAEAELEALRARINEKQSQLDLLKLSERSRSRDGIPTLIAENALGRIEADTNWALEQLPTADGATFHASFITQREQKSVEHLKETLEVVITAPDYEQRSESLSGGEETRVALAIGFALAARLDASSFLGADELPYLDDLGEEAVVELLKASVARGMFRKVLCVSHSPNVHDSFDQVIEVVKEDGRSRLARDRERVTA